MNNGDFIKALAAKAGKLPEPGTDKAMARLIANHGNYTAEAKAYAAEYAKS